MCPCVCLQQYTELWHHLDSAGILEETLLDYVWRDVLQQKPVLLGLMEKFDLLCPRFPNNVCNTLADMYCVLRVLDVCAILRYICILILGAYVLCFSNASVMLHLSMHKCYS